VSNAPVTKNRLALVTGASAGLGAEFARQLAAARYDVVLVARRRERLEALAQELMAKHDVQAIVLPCDLARMEARDDIMAALATAAPGRSIDMLVNNAGFSIPASFAATDWQRESDMIMTLVYAVCSLTHAVLPDMIAKGNGRIINVASVAGFAPGVAGHTLYPAAKSFVIKFSQSLAAEVASKGIQVTALCPGYTRTEFQTASGMDDLAAKTPRRFADEPSDVVRQAIAANREGRVIIVTGLHNRLSRLALKVIPEFITRPLINRAAARFRKSED
jgi:uncharacterized protein